MVVKEMEQLPAATLPIQLCVPSEIVTFPVGVPLPGAVAVTLKLMLTIWSIIDGSGKSLVITVVVTARLTICGMMLDILPPK